MSVKVRKVGNSFAVTIPTHIVNQLRLRHGQSLEVRPSAHGWEYQLPHPYSGRVAWEEYETLDANVRDGLSPEEYVRSMREQDRDEIVF